MVKVGPLVAAGGKNSLPLSSLPWPIKITSTLLEVLGMVLVFLSSSLPRYPGG